MKKILLILLLFTICPFTSSAEVNGPMRVHFIDVGQGDSILIETPENQTILIDGGEPQAGKTVVRYLKENHIKEIDLIVATHADYDHIGGLSKVIRQFPVRKIIDNGKIHFTKTYASYRMLLFNKEIPIEIASENQRINLEKSINIRVLNAKGPGKNPNQSSIVLKISYGDIDFLLMSDVEADQEEKIANTYDVEAEILKVAHHGSKTSSSFEFLKKAKSQAAIISYSRENDYGHPVESVIENLKKLKTQIYSTAIYGNIIVETDGENYIILPEMSPMEKLIKDIS